MAQDYQLTISSRQRTHHAFNFYAPFFALALLFRAESSAFKRQIVVVSFGAIAKRSFAAGIPAQMIDGCVMSNLVNPGREFKLRPVARKRPVNFDENLLGKIQCRLVI